MQLGEENKQIDDIDAKWPGRKWKRDPTGLLQQGPG